MSFDDVKSDRRYTREHEWAKVVGDTAQIGISAFAVSQLGDITLVNLDVRSGDTVTAGKAIGTIESVKTLSDVFSPLSGKVTRVNAELESQPELVNDDCYGKAWMIEITPSDPSELEALLDAAAYAELLKTSAY